ncbi:ABC transporter substrate-binding protein [Paeniglutamicibacter psychrophenolicus]|uniref:Polar amino acid transport system substrate-binding protein n=1 Tax=Paeniglutamicibacter psychrophenolicus TaxID=257454 RepID=A0ABS4WAG4_9MICC|nr:ABC transporter substrate-binding protein [Paeniglutamicibacter psychrophenolicus]MBP2373186.1 polar amino acid transport system substrate-binding protein [Paeniglutamicibacter psychrophenolicus]
MKRSTKNIALKSVLSSLAAAALLATTACGGQSLAGGDPTPSASGAAAAFTAVPAPDEDLAKSAIDEIKANPELTAILPEAIQKEGLKMTTSEGYPPMELYAKDGKTLVGVDPSVGRALANKLGVNLTIKDEDFNAQIPGITTGRYDMIMSSMTDNEERRKTVTFVDYVQAGNGWVVKEGNPAGLGNPESACGKTVAVVDNGSSLDLVTGFSKECEDAGKSKINILKFSGDQEAILQVRNGRADAGVNDYPVAAYRAQISEGALEAVAIDGPTSPWGIAMKPENEQLIEAMQKALQELIDDGTYKQVLEAWNVGQMAVDSAKINDGK